MKILFCSSEVAPFAKTGGLADVAGSLPLALGRLGADVLVTMPRYRGILETEKKLGERVTIRFIAHEEYYNRSALYGTGDGDYPDNLDRFSYFCHESLERARREDFKPDIVHAHDWHVALIPVLLKTKFSSDPFFKQVKSLLTIHNLAYQGHFAAEDFTRLGLDPSLFVKAGFEFYGRGSLLKAGLHAADYVNTVSPTYAQEIRTEEFGCGLEGVLRERHARLSGILNGIDHDVWNPSRDAAIASQFSSKDLKGKAVCKARLQKKCGWAENPRIPLFAMVTRLAEQKGIDLLVRTADEIFSRNAQLVLLGDGDRGYQSQCLEMAQRHSKKVKVFIGFQAAEAHSIYAGADFFLMPSLFEPCGLGQLIAMRYGAIPVARKTGGLADTVVDVDTSVRNANGVVFERPESSDLLRATDRAIALYEDLPRLGAVRARAMQYDFSWEHSAGEYVKLYERMRDTP